ncbi:hypothetical protein B0T24DRAFT_679876 [Lasiosphaeria ovina]|uniref:Rhodopsin domain-containing protein n=1 Tax=Lasiosphaeria ovina TaxID=92902 RepID=A0AAE0K6T2_9PEZI|nr:hypothetical protein B0T24DRAFT_679876 [Lasiosphaeria ovina]
MALVRFGGRLTGLELYPEGTRIRRNIEVQFPLALEVFGKPLKLSSCYWLLIASWLAGRHDIARLRPLSWDMDTSPWTDTLIKMTRATFTITAASWSKLAFAATMLRLADNGWMRWTLWFIIVSLNIVMALNAMISWVGCSPVQKSWNMTGVDGTCLDISVISNIGYVAGGYSAACDFTLALLPWAVIWKLQMKKKEKLGFGIAMSMGIVAGIALAHPIMDWTGQQESIPGDASQLIIWDTAEISVTSMVASIPLMRVLFREVQNISSAGDSGRDGQDILYRVDEVDIESRSANDNEMQPTSPKASS